MSAEQTPEARACAYCGTQPRAAAFSPFCSKGCADRDLLNWLGEGYRVPDTTPLDSEGDPV
jgi:endogenous inhibitor of DNA gyrase (YacG/DUF329 family)